MELDIKNSMKTKLDEFLKENDKTKMDKVHMNMIHDFENIPEEKENTDENIIYDIHFTISDYLQIQDVPYSKIDGEKEISDDSIHIAAQNVFKMLKEKGIIK